MGILDLFKSKAPKEPTYEIVEARISLDHQRYKVRIKKAGREFYAEELFQGARNPADLTFSRLFVLEENPLPLHFAPSLQEAVDWFRGRKSPKDGYNTIWWGEKVTYKCSICGTKRVVPLRISRVERLTVVSTIPTHREIVGWRVLEVESELTGRGIPAKKLDKFKTLPVLKWRQFPSQYLCCNCAQRLTAAGRGAEVADYFVFELG
jgi:hypothetical protein